MKAWIFAVVLFPSVAWADVPPDDGGGCKCDSSAVVGAPFALIGVLGLLALRRR